MTILFLATGCVSTNTNMESSDAGTSLKETPSDTGVLSIPVDFPNNIPIYPGEIVVSTATGETNARTWVVEVLVDDLEDARVKVLSDLTQANFVLQEESGIGTNEYLATLTNTVHLIRLKVYLESDTGQKEVMYIVTGA